MKHQKVYELLRQRMADSFDVPDIDEIIAATVEVCAQTVEEWCAYSSPMGPMVSQERVAAGIRQISDL